MTQTTVIRILAGGEPLAGAQVCVSDKSAMWRETDENGEVSSEFEDNEVFCSLIAVKMGDGAIYTAHAVIEAGDTCEVSVPG